jgi:hypothetical protein
MRQRRLDRNLCLILPAGLLFVSAANSLFADSLTITGTATSSNVAGIAVGDQWTGTLTTNGTCLLYAPANGGLLGLSINMYGDLLSATDAEGYPNFPSFDRTAGNLSFAASGTSGDIISVGAPTGTFSLSRNENFGVSGTFDVSGPAPCSVTTSNTSNFNGAAINPGTFIWFSSNFTVKGVGSQAVNAFFQNQTIQFTAHKPYSLTVPNAVVTFDPTASCPSTTFDYRKSDLANHPPTER